MRNTTVSGNFAVVGGGMGILTGTVTINNSTIAGNPAYLPPPDTDQRGAGFPRVRGGRIDIGAYESAGASTLTIQLSLPGRPAPPHAAWITTAQVEVRPAIGAPILAGNFASNTSGHVFVPDLPLRSYTLWVKEAHSVGQSFAITLVAGANSLTMAAVKAGDADGNNLVNITDFSLLATAFSLLATNFNQVGVP